MSQITTRLITDEKTWQGQFYAQLFGPDLNGITIGRSTDGYTRGILFEQKTNIQSYGESKALGQALIYLTRFNRDGEPVPAKICLVSQEEQECYIYDTSNYMKIINDIPQYANLKASNGIPGFSAGARTEKISFDMSSAASMHDMLNFVRQQPETVKVDINSHNVYGWANYYYKHARENGQKPEKKAFFRELRDPVGTLREFINPWDGQETDFKYIMDMLNDPMTQKKLGAFYTPPAYCRKATELVMKAIERVPKGNDYVIIDKCAGTGNLEMYLDDIDDNILSHCILSTYELKEWMVLKDRFGGRVRYIIPPIPKEPNALPELNEEGFLRGANALTREIIDNPVIRKHLDDPKCTIILYENPPYAETTSIEFQKKGAGKEASDWKNNFVVNEMKKEVSGATSNDMANAFIWSGFKFFLRQPTDSYIVFSPIKYWKAQKLISKKFIDGFAFNREHFHAKTAACVSCILWSNEDDKMTSKFNLHAFDIDGDELVDEGTISVKQINSLFSEKYYDNRIDKTDTFDGIVCELNGCESNKTDGQIRVLRNWNENIVGYMLTKTSGFDNPRLSSNLLVAGKYDANGFYLRKDNFLEKLPCFAASRYTDNCNDWKIMSMVMKSGDKAEQYHADVASGKLDVFLCKTLIWTGLTHYAHMRSLDGSDGRFYRNELCFDNLDGKTTLARQKLEEFIADGYVLTAEERSVFSKWEEILQRIKNQVTMNGWTEYNPKYTYGLYQIDEEINIKTQSTQEPWKKDGSPNMVIRDGDLNDKIKSLKGMLKTYYIDNLADTLFEYEFLK